MRTTVMKSWRSLVSAVAVIAVANACGSGSISGGGDKVVAGLRFVSQPTATSAAGTTFTLSVELLDAGGAKIGNADDVVSLTVNGGANLVGNTSIAAVSGVATFPGLSVTRTGTGFTISASANGVTASSSSFTVTPAAANGGQSSATFNPTTVIPGATIAVTFTFKDQYGNPIPNKTVTLSTNLAGVTFTPSTGSTSATGTFTTNMVATGIGSATLSATVDGVAISLPTAVTVTAPPSFIIATSSNPANGGTTTGGGTFASNSAVTVSATANNGFVFGNWTEGGAQASVNASYAFTATANRNLVANFCAVSAMTFPGSNPGTVASTGCFTNGQASQFFSMTAVPASAHSLTVNSSFSGVNVTVFQPGLNSAVQLTNAAATPTTVSGEWLLPAGTFNVRAAATSAASGTFTLVGASTPLSNSACGFRFIVGSITIGGQSVAASDCAYGDGTFFDPFVIASSQTCTFTLSSTVFQVWLEIFNADLSTSLATQAGTANPSAGSPSVASRTGPCNNGGQAIVVIANNFNVGSVGAYTLTVAATSAGPPSFMSLFQPSQAFAPDADRASKWVPVSVGGKPIRR